MSASFHKHNVDGTHLFTMHLPVVITNLFTVRTVDELITALQFCREHSITPHIIGGGSNSLPPPVIDCVIKNEISDIEWNNTHTSDIVTIGAGVVWDDFVNMTCDRGWYDLCALTAIPGTVGATPIQNVGAYGTEVSNHIITVSVLDTETQTTQIIPGSECGFAYRDSKFKHEWAGKYVVTAVTFELRNKEILVPDYPGVADEVNTIAAGGKIFPETITTAISNIRWRKLPKPEILGNCGSYFHNPIISKQQFEKLKEIHPNIPGHPVTDDTIKVPAGWLLDQCGCRGIRRGNFGTSPDNALVVVHYGGGTLDELLEFQEYLTQTVRDTYGITLVREPLLLES